MKRTLVAAFMLFGAVTAQAQECPIYDDIVKLDHAMVRTATKLMYGQNLRVVALGSSSTSGAGASLPANSYPSRLEVELKHRYPHVEIAVLNKGVGGETVHEMLARLENTVLDEQPDLVIFQVGTNTVLRGQSVEDAEVKIHDAIRRMQARGVDVLLMDAQYAPAVITKPLAPVMQDVLVRAGKRFGISVFRRHDLMKRWHEQGGIPVAQFTHPDNLHMNDWSYGCVAKAIATAIADGVNRQLALIP